MTNKSSPWLERQRRHRAGPKVLTPEEADAAGLPLTKDAVSYHVYSGVRLTMTESDLWVGGDFSAIPVSLDAKLSDGSPRFIKRPDGTWFDLYGKTPPGILEDFAEMDLRIKAEFLEDIAKIESWTKARLDAYRTGLDRDEAQVGRVGTWPTMMELHEKMTRPDAPTTQLSEWLSLFFPPAGTAINTLHWIKDGVARPKVMEWTGDAWLMIGDATRYRPEHTELRGCEYLGSAHLEDSMDVYKAGLERDEAQKKLDSVIGKFNYACNAVNELQTDLNAVTTERNALRDALAKFTDPDVKPPEPPINHALRVKIGDPRRMGP